MLTAALAGRTMDDPVAVSSWPRLAFSNQRGDVGAYAAALPPLPPLSWEMDSSTLSRIG